MKPRTGQIFQSYVWNLCCFGFVMSFGHLVAISSTLPLSSLLVVTYSFLSPPFLEYAPPRRLPYLRQSMNFLDGGRME